MKLGAETDTEDAIGKIIEEKEVDIRNLEEEKVKKVLENFKGKREQVPPIYSAIKVNGKKLYEYAREGKEVKIEPRQIEIYDINLENIDKENKEIDIKVHTSKGTYIRSICRDISRELRRNTVI